MTTNAPPDTTSTSPALFRYGLLGAGLILALLGGLILEHKKSNAQDAQGDVVELALEIKTLKQEAADTKSAKEKKELENKAKDLEAEDLKEATKEAEFEQADATDGVWILSMLRYLGVSCMALGFLFLAGIGSPYERAGALIALGFMASRVI